jgi:hypothetical protein
MTPNWKIIASLVGLAVVFLLALMLTAYTARIP